MSIIYFMDPATSIAEGIIALHDLIMYYLIVIIVLVMWLLGAIVLRYNSERSYADMVAGNYGYVTFDIKLEVIWTILPSVVLFLIAIPSFSLLYIIDEVVEPQITLKVIGNQWYWTYEHTHLGTDLIYDSYMVDSSALKEGDLRLLEVDNAVVLPVSLPTRFLITSRDVLHSWSVNAFGVKMDAVPGRLNQAYVSLKRLGAFTGQCSELCGVNHGLMPIFVYVVSLEEYIDWFWVECGGYFKERLLSERVLG